MKKNYLILLIVLLIIIGCESRMLQRHPIDINIENTIFYELNKDIIDKSVQFLKDNCLTKDKMDLNLSFSGLPGMLVNISPEKVGMTSFFHDVTMIETNIFNYVNLSEKQKTIYFLHELGHAVGLNHVENDEKSIMFFRNNGLGDLNSFKLTLREHCGEIKDVPRKPNYIEN